MSRVLHKTSTASSFYRSSPSLQAAQLLNSDTSRRDFEGRLDSGKLLQLVGASLVFQASDPRDKIFGLLGLPFGHIQRKSPGRDSIWNMALPGGASIVPDYSKSISEVYRNTAFYIMNAMQNLLLLEMKEPTGDSALLTDSWVYDWCATYMNNPVYYLLTRDATFGNDLPVAEEPFWGSTPIMPFSLLTVVPADTLWPSPSLCLACAPFASVELCEFLPPDQGDGPSHIDGPSIAHVQTDSQWPFRAALFEAFCTHMRDSLIGWKFGMLSMPYSSGRSRWAAIFPPSTAHGDEVVFLSGAHMLSVIRRHRANGRNGEGEANDPWICSYVGPVFIDPGGREVWSSYIEGFRDLFRSSRCKDLDVMRDVRLV
jgi:hypothetical protein